MQRVTQAAVTVEGRVTGAVEAGMLVLVGFTAKDDATAIGWMADKVADLRIFPDDDGKMNRDLGQAGGAVLVVSQFTLYGDATQGRRPSFIAAAPAAQAEPLYRQFLDALRARGLTVATGVFGAMMQVSLVNDGPVTLVIER